MSWILEDTGQRAMALARCPGTAGLALLLLTGAQGMLSGQHNLGERGVRGSGARLGLPLPRA